MEIVFLFRFKVFVCWLRRSFQDIVFSFACSSLVVFKSRKTFVVYITPVVFLLYREMSPILCYIYRIALPFYGRLINLFSQLIDKFDLVTTETHKLCKWNFGYVTVTKRNSSDDVGRNFCYADPVR